MNSFQNFNQVPELEAMEERQRKKNTTPKEDSDSDSDIKIRKFFLDLQRWQKEGWNDETIETYFEKLAAISISKTDIVTEIDKGINRSVFSKLVAQRNYNFTTAGGGVGVAYSGQKPAEESCYEIVTNNLILDMLRKTISPEVSSCLLSPVGIEMSMTVILMTLKLLRPEVKYVLVSKIDLRANFEYISSVGLEPLVVEGIIPSEEVRTNLNKITNVIYKYSNGKEILCVITTTSCFAPGGIDSVEEVAKLCAHHDIFHVVNNSFGLASANCRRAIVQSIKKGRRLDVFLQSTDENLMVPVGGTIIGGFNPTIIDSMCKHFPGFLAPSPSQNLDIFITLMSMGSNKYQELVSHQNDIYGALSDVMLKFAVKNKEHSIITSSNDISYAVTMNNLRGENKDHAAALAEFHSLLVKKNLPGISFRVVPRSLPTGIDEGYNFARDSGSGSSTGYPYSYLSAAIGIGTQLEDVSAFALALDEIMSKVNVNVNPHRQRDLTFDEYFFWGPDLG